MNFSQRPAGALRPVGGIAPDVRRWCEHLKRRLMSRARRPVFRRLPAPGFPKQAKYRFGMGDFL
ncbi:hypothetical protein DENIS_4998 [Desulfonema ishimotonii]|uniref:Uncharacterized protein n=1 Tax=Desulfonema ishimotonii TaxID=45657 RepID=A0A401G430_9BACT|nr:hypothetical protein [Desulfonema ishimotonii]GBC63998.1 hypothetical protein DENIS_4998 [Desulfonema ishimotonii]